MSRTPRSTRAFRSSGRPAPRSPFARARSFRLGDLFDAPAQQVPDLPLWLDRPLDLRPSLGTTVRLGDIAALVRALADQLQDAGVKPRQRVVVIKQSSLDIAVLKAAIARVGAVPALLWHEVAPATVQTLLQRLDRPFVVTDEGVRDRALAGLDLAGLTRGVFMVREGGLEAERHGEPPAVAPLDLPSDVVLITHTSGTTGVPKLVGYPAVALGAHIELAASVAAAFGMRGPGAFCHSFVHGRMTSALGVAFARRMPVAALTDPSPASAGPILARLRPQLLESFPNVFIQWEELADAPERPLSNVQYFVNTFDAVHPRTVQRLLDGSDRRAPLYFQTYGTTETGPLTVRVHNRRSSRHSDGRCVGYPIPGFTRVRVRPTAPGARTGEIEARALGAARVYVGEPERRAPGSQRSWWRTGDLGTFGRWRCLHLLDRAVDESPDVASNLAIEDRVLERMPSLSEVVVVPLPGSKPVPVVCTAGDRELDRGAWRAAIAGEPALADPVHLPWDAVPRTSTWKVRRLELRRQLEESRAAPAGNGR